LQLGQELSPLTGHVFEVIAACQEHEQAQATSFACQKTRQEECRGICHMGIIEDEYMRHCGRDMAQIIEHRDKAREPPVRAICYVGSEQALGSVQVAEHHVPWPQGRGFAIAPAPANGGVDSTAPGPQRHLLGKSGLPDSGRPADHHHLPVALLGGAQELH
jgi:hypothetical protein